MDFIARSSQRGLDPAHDPVVAHLGADDLLAAAAYLASLKP
jgi:hypothetical protein